MLLSAAVLFLSGLMTGYQQAQSTLLDTTTLRVAEQVKDVDQEVKETEQESNLKIDLLERQKRLKETQTENIFSKIGQSLDFFK